MLNDRARVGASKGKVRTVDRIHVADDHVGRKAEAKSVIEAGIRADDSITGGKFPENTTIGWMTADDDDGVNDGVLLDIRAFGLG